MGRIIQIICLFILLNGLSGSAQNMFQFDSSKVSYKSLKIANKIAKGNILESNTMYANAIPSHQYRLYELLLEYSSEKELIALTSFPNGVVRCYAFMGLLEFKSESILNVINKHTNDFEVIDTQMGCFSLQYAVYVFMVFEAKKHAKNRLRNKISWRDKKRIKRHDKIATKIFFGRNV